MRELALYRNCIIIIIVVSENKRSEVGDIMAHQLKFIACLKIMMEELATLATGFEVDGGQLRYQLYVWLEKEVDVLKKLCNYGQDMDTANLPGEHDGQYVCVCVWVGLGGWVGMKILTEIFFLSQGRED